MKKMLRIDDVLMDRDPRVVERDREYYAILEEHAEEEPERINALKKCSRPECDRIESAVNEFDCCSQCKAGYYCSKKCQKKHWKIHKKVCRKK